MNTMWFVSWIKTHKLVAFLTLLVVYLLFGLGGSTSLTSMSIPRMPQDYPSKFSYETQRFSPGAASSSSDRIVVQNTNLSLVVKDVRAVGEEIVSYARSVGGFMVATSYDRPTESAFATVTVRVPTNRLDEALRVFRSLGIKVTSENVYGEDVTDQYTDIEARMATLRKTEAKFKELLDKATTVSDILSVQRELINLQDQIDALRGQKESIEKQAALTKVTVYLATDELALPYVPDTTFRPAVIFKQAVRSVVETLRRIGEFAVWVGVYSVIWAPLLGGYVFARKWQERRKKAPLN